MYDPKLLSEDEVKGKLGISDFRSINKNQLISFVSSLPDIDKEVAIHCIEQFPEFKESSNIIIDRFYELCQTTIQSDEKEDIRGYKLILDSLKALLEQDHISEPERSYIIEKMVIVGEHLEGAVDKRRGFNEFVLKLGGVLAATAITVGGAILGAKTGLIPPFKDR